MKTKPKVKPEVAKKSPQPLGAGIPTDFKDYLASQMREMADNLAKQFLEKVGDQQKEERNKRSS